MIVVTVARKPLAEANVAANTLVHGTGALSVDACRVRYRMGEVDFSKVQRQQSAGDAGAVAGAFGVSGLVGTEIPTYKPGGRWPANVVFEHLAGCSDTKECVDGCPVAALDAQSGVIPTGSWVRQTDGAHPFGNAAGSPYERWQNVKEPPGGAARFFKQVGGRR